MHALLSRVLLCRSRQVTGGVHGANRLAGNSLLECVVFGRIAGKRASMITQDILPGEASSECHPYAICAQGRWSRCVCCQAIFRCCLFYCFTYCVGIRRCQQLFWIRLSALILKPLFWLGVANSPQDGILLLRIVHLNLHPNIPGISRPNDATQEGKHH